MYQRFLGFEHPASQGLECHNQGRTTSPGLPAAAVDQAEAATKIGPDKTRLRHDQTQRDSPADESAEDLEESQTLHLLGVRRLRRQKCYDSLVKNHKRCKCALKTNGVLMIPKMHRLYKTLL